MYLLSIDLESWVHRPVYNLPLNGKQKMLDSGFTKRSTYRLLEILKKHNCKATFFILGRIIEWYPEIIERILNDGHEIGYHSLSHEFIHKLSIDGFEKEIERGHELLNAYNVSPIGFRSPSFSRTKQMTEILKSFGYKYDSSIIPIKTPLYDGVEFKDSKPFIWSNGLLEIPVSVFPFRGDLFKKSCAVFCYSYSCDSVFS